MTEKFYDFDKLMKHFSPEDSFSPHFSSTDSQFLWNILLFEQKSFSEIGEFNSSDQGELNSIIYIKLLDLRLVKLTSKSRLLLSLFIR